MLFVRPVTLLYQPLDFLASIQCCIQRPMLIIESSFRKVREY